MRVVLLSLIVAWAPAAGAAAQSLEQRVAAIGTGTARLSFPARYGVCGSVHGISVHQGSDEWEHDCGPQEVRVALRVVRHRVVGVQTYVGGRWRQGAAATDLGSVRPQEAAAYLITLAERGKELEGDPVQPAVLADSVTIWPSLLKLARTATLNGSLLEKMRLPASPQKGALCSTAHHLSPLPRAIAAP